MTLFEKTLSEMKDAQLKFARGEITKEEMAVSQRAHDYERERLEFEARQPEREAERARQQEVWDSISDEDRDRIRRMAIELDCVRDLDGFRYFVPHTMHWAGWRDDDAVRFHGVTNVDLLCERFLTYADEPWDGTYQHLWDF